MVPILSGISLFSWLCCHSFSDIDKIAVKAHFKRNKTIYDEERRQDLFSALSVHVWTAQWEVFTYCCITFYFCGVLQQVCHMKTGVQLYNQRLSSLSVYYNRRRYSQQLLLPVTTHLADSVLSNKRYPSSFLSCSLIAPRSSLCKSSCCAVPLDKSLLYQWIFFFLPWVT